MNTSGQPLSEDAACLALDIIREARHVFGRAELRLLWRQLGLPIPPDTTARPANPLRAKHAVKGEPKTMVSAREAVERFFRQRCVSDTSSELRASVALDAFNAWAPAQGHSSLSAVAFGKVAAQIGVSCRKSGTRIYTGYRLA